MTGMTTSSESFTLKPLTDVKDSAPGFGFEEAMQVRFATEDLDAEHVGVSHHRVAPGKRQPFGHKHVEAEEVYVVIGGSGRAALDDQVVELQRLDALRVAPDVTRAFEAGPDGLEYVVFGARCEGDGEIVPGFWAG